MQNVRAYRGADVESDYDLIIAHYLPTLIIAHYLQFLKLKKHTGRCPLPAKPLFASAKLKDKELNT